MKHVSLYLDEKSEKAWKTLKKQSIDLQSFIRTALNLKAQEGKTVYKEIGSGKVITEFKKETMCYKIQDNTVKRVNITPFHDELLEDVLEYIGYLVDL